MLSYHMVIPSLTPLGHLIYVQTERNELLVAESPTCACKVKDFFFTNMKTLNSENSITVCLCLLQLSVTMIVTTY